MSQTRMSNDGFEVPSLATRPPLSMQSPPNPAHGPAGKGEQIQLDQHKSPLGSEHDITAASPSPAHPTPSQLEPSLPPYPLFIPLPDSPTAQAVGNESANDSVDDGSLRHRLRKDLKIPAGQTQDTNSDNKEELIETAIQSEKDEEKASTDAKPGADKDWSLVQRKLTTQFDGEDPLRPDPGTEDDFEVRENPFAFSPGQLGKLLNPKSPAAFYALGGLYGLEKGLRTDIVAGLDYDEDFAGTNVTFAEAVDKAASGLQRVSSTRPSAISSIEQTFSRIPTTFTSGEHANSFRERRRVFGNGLLPPLRSQSLLFYIRKELLDSVLIVLTAAALITIALGLYQSLRQNTHNEDFSWPEGVAICVAVAIVTFLNAINEWRKEHHFCKLDQQKERRDRLVKVIRTGKVRMIPMSNVLVGDIAVFVPGDTIFADGVLIRGHGVRCDESLATGESDLVKKTPTRSQSDAKGPTKDFDPFMISGSMINTGRGSFLVTAVGIHSCDGRLWTYLRTYHDGITDTALQQSLSRLANWVAKSGITISMVLFLVLFIRFLAQLKHSNENGISKGLDFFSLFVTAVTLVDVAVPSGLPLAMTVSLAFATRQLLKKRILVRNLSAFQESQFATTICTDKTGLLTENTMSIVAGVIGVDEYFEDVLLKKTSENQPYHTEQDGRSASEVILAQPNSLQYLIGLHHEIKELMRLSIMATMTAFEGELNGHAKFYGSQMDSALFDFARRHLSPRGTALPPSAVSRQISVEKVDFGRLSMETALTWSHAPQTCYLKSEACRFTICITALNGGKYRMFVTGLARPLLKKCSHTILDRKREADFILLNVDAKDAVEAMIDKFASSQLRVVGFAFKDLEELPPHQLDESGLIRLDHNTRLNDDHLFDDMTFLCAFGIKDPIRKNATEAVQLARRAGVGVRLVTADDVVTAKAVAEDTGILFPGSVVMEGSTLQRLTLRELDEVLPRLVVLARASSADKQKLVMRLKELGETVAVTAHGHTVHDVSALKAANVSFSLESTSTDVSKSASDVILLEDDFQSIVDTIFWGRAIGDGVRKFLQFQLTIGLSAIILTFVSSAISSSRQSVINSVQLLWVNLIMDLFSVLALATDSPLTSEHDRIPPPRRRALVNMHMWKMIFGQVMFQLAVTLVLYATDLGILNYNQDLANRDTLVFNTFVWMQVFNQINCRRLDDKIYVFEGLRHNKFFILVTIVIVGIQLLLIFFGGKAINTVDLAPAQWGCSLVMGAVTLPVGMVIRLVPNDWLIHLFKFLLPGVNRWLERRKPGPEAVVSDDYQWNQSLLDIKDELAFIKKLKGGRLRGIGKHFWSPHTLFPARRSRSRSRSSSRRRSPSADGEAWRRRSGSRHDSRRNRGSGSGYNSRAASADGEGWRRSGSRVHSRAGSFISAVSAPGVLAGGVAMSPATQMAGIVAASIEGWEPVSRTETPLSGTRGAFGAATVMAGIAAGSVSGGEPISRTGSPVNRTASPEEISPRIEG